MDSTQAFALFDCNLARCATGRTCSNLRELLDSIRTASDAAIEHHMMRCALDDHFELYEFPNDLARWCWDALGDDVLAEQLGLIDPYQHPSIAALRDALVNVIEERLWESDRVPSCRPGLELHLIESRLVAYDTGERFTTPAALAEALPKCRCARCSTTCTKRAPAHGGTHRRFLGLAGAVRRRRRGWSLRLRGVDFYFLNLNQLRSEFIDVFRSQFSKPTRSCRSPRKEAVT